MTAPQPTYRIRCVQCGYERDRFHGWVFAITECRTPGQPNMLHRWEAMHDPDEPTADPEATFDVDLAGPSEFDVLHIKEILGGMGDWWSARFIRLCAHSDRAHLEALRRAAPAHVAAYERWRQEGS